MLHIKRFILNKNIWKFTSNQVPKIYMTSATISKQTMRDPVLDSIIDIKKQEYKNAQKLIERMAQKKEKYDTLLGYEKHLYDAYYEMISVDGKKT